MNRVVLDASAAIATFAKEPGSDKVEAVLENTVISSVNLTEICGKLMSRGLQRVEAEEAALNAAKFIIPFDTEQALLAGAISQKTRALGLSLADRACLALAMTLKSPVYTTDKAWKKLDFGIPIYLIR
jgi:PIN domain nuclease of toxin-antitoxin system